MGNTAENVSTGKPRTAGAVFVAASGATLPTDAKTALDTTKFTCLGYVSDDGLKNSTERSLSQIKAWGGDIVYQSLTEFKDPFTLKLIEAVNTDALKAVYGDSNVTTASGLTTVNVKAEELPTKVWVFDIALRDGKLERIVIPKGQVTEVGEIVYTDEEAVGYEITITPYPDSNGIYHKRYIS